MNNNSDSNYNAEGLKAPRAPTQDKEHTETIHAFVALHTKGRNTTSATRAIAKQVVVVSRQAGRQVSEYVSKQVVVVA